MDYTFRSKLKADLNHTVRRPNISIIRGVKKMAGISKTVVNLKPGKMEEVTKLIDSQSGLVTGLEGNIGFAVAVTGEDELTIIGIYQSSQNARDASDTVQKVFSEMADCVASPPDRSVSSGVWFPAI